MDRVASGTGSCSLGSTSSGGDDGGGGHRGSWSTVSTGRMARTTHHWSAAGV